MACITNSDYIEAAQKQADAIRTQAMTDVAIQTALALWQRNSSLSISNMQDAIANRNMKLAEAVYAHAQNFWPIEKAIVDDAFSETKASPQYSSTSAQWSSILDDSLRKGRTDWIEEMKSRCIVPTDCEAARWDRAAQLARADILSFADRQSENRAEALNDQRYARQLAALGIGKGILQNVKSFSNLSGTAGMSAGKILADSINSGLMAYGYYTTDSKYEGWGHGIRDNFARMPYPVAPAATSQLPTPETPSGDPCGPAPEITSAEWAAWVACKGGK